MIPEVIGSGGVFECIVLFALMVQSNAEWFFLEQAMASFEPFSH